MTVALQFTQDLEVESVKQLHSCTLKRFSAQFMRRSRRFAQEYKHHASELRHNPAEFGG
jgi:hypothetical protein